MEIHLSRSYGNLLTSIAGLVHVNVGFHQTFGPLAARDYHEKNVIKDGAKKALVPI